jgi:hypothetical protein
VIEAQHARLDRKKTWGKKSFFWKFGIIESGDRLTGMYVGRAAVGRCCGFEITYAVVQRPLAGPPPDGQANRRVTRDSLFTTS